MQKQRLHGLAPHYEERLERALSQLGHSLRAPGKLADAVLRLSDHYIANPQARTPWKDGWAKAASLAYYFPLNYARNAAVFMEAKRLGFFEGLQSAIDFGSGAGSALAALQDLHPDLKRRLAIDVDPAALEICRALVPDIHTHLSSSSEAPPEFRAKNALVISSYAMTELDGLPEWWLDAEALAILEPSTQEDGRKLMRTRAQLIENGFQIWAPCTHQGSCPLLAQSERDWCHDRIHWQAPAWFTALEKSLPMKNRTITFSYLLARKRKAPEKLGAYARLTGDQLDEKGKVRQSLCRGPEREFLSWFPQRLKTAAPEFERGLLLRFLENPELKSNELRFREPSSQLAALGADESLGS